MGYPSSKERRRLRRIIKRIPASFWSEDAEGQGYIKNISKEGLFLRVEALPLPGTLVKVLIEPENGPKIEVSGTVRWTTDQLPSSAEASPGFGVKLETISEDFKDLFADVILGQTGRS
jgi:hypothetical protein